MNKLEKDEMSWNLKISQRAVTWQEQVLCLNFVTFFWHCFYSPLSGHIRQLCDNWCSWRWSHTVSSTCSCNTLTIVLCFVLYYFYVLNKTEVKHLTFSRFLLCTCDAVMCVKYLSSLCCYKQVILSGGAVNSPQLLMLSGIGPADELQRHSIPLVHHLPGVGRNLQDHLEVFVKYRCTQPLTLYRYQVPAYPASSSVG